MSEPVAPSLRKKIAFAFFIVLTVAMTGAVMAYRLALARAYVQFSRAEAPLPADGQEPLHLTRTARGEQLIAHIGCSDCHGPSLRGGVVAEKKDHYRIVAPDLVGGAQSDAKAYALYWHALRLGLDSDNRALWAMPRTALLHLAQDDVLALCDALVARRRAARAQARGSAVWPKGFVGGRGYLDLLSGSLTLVDDAVPAPPQGGWPQQAPDPADAAANEAYLQHLKFRAPASRW